MFGSLVVIYQTDHEGGALVFREGRKEWTFDSATAVADWDGACVAYAAYYGDVDHDITMLDSGYRIAVTYKLRFANTHIPPSLPSLGFTV